MTDIVERLRNTDHKRFPYFDTLLTEAADLIEANSELVSHLRARVAELEGVEQEFEEYMKRKVDEITIYERAFKSMCEELAAEREALLAEQVLSDRLEDALLTMKRDTWHWQQIRDAALAEVSAIRAGKQYE